MYTLHNIYYLPTMMGVARVGIIVSLAIITRAAAEVHSTRRALHVVTDVCK